MRGRTSDETAALLGLLIGVGWWCSPEIVYFAAPLAVLFLVALLRRRLRVSVSDLAVFLVLFVVGALPWLWSNLRSDFASLRSSKQPYPGFSEHLHVFLTHAFPIAVGTQLTATGNWLGGSLVGPFLAFVAAAVVFGFLALCCRERRAGFLVLFCVLFPFIYSASPFTWYWRDARYVIYLPPILAIAVAGAVDAAGIRIRFKSLGQWKRALVPASVAVVVALGSTLAAASLRAPFHPDGRPHSPEQTWGSFSFSPNGFETQIAVDLRRLGIHDIIVGYWLAYPIDFLSDEQVAASDIVFVRNQQLLNEVTSSAASRPGSLPTTPIPRFASSCRRRGPDSWIPDAPLRSRTA